MAQNKKVVLIMGKPNTGKSTSLRNLDQSKMAYLNTDLKEIPFRDQFAANVEISNATDIFDFITEIEENSELTGGVLDTLTMLMTMYERQYVINAANGQKAWGEYGTFYRELIHAIKAGSKNYAILAHEETRLNEQNMTMESMVPIKGAVGKIGAEADFTTILCTKQMPVKKLKSFENELLKITPEEEEDGMKYVFCTRVTKDHLGEKMRSAIGLWKREELYIDNDVSAVFKRLQEYYGT